MSTLIPTIPTLAPVTLDAAPVDANLPVPAPAKPALRPGHLPYAEIVRYDPQLAERIYDAYDLSASSRKGAASLNPGDLYGKVSARDYQKLEIITKERTSFLNLVKGSLGTSLASAAPLTVGIVGSMTALELVGGIGFFAGLAGLFVSALVSEDVPKVIQKAVDAVNER